MKTASTLTNPIDEIFGPPPPLEITESNTALIIVDMQYFDAHPDWGEGRTAHELGVADLLQPYHDQVDAAIPYIRRLLALFREKEMEVIHLRVAELTQDSRDIGRNQLVRGLMVPSNSKEAQILDELVPVGDEIVISKSAAGAFAVTSLDRVLQNLGITTLVFVGTITGGCVENAVQDAADIGYDVLVVADACMDPTPAHHDLSLRLLNSGLIRVRSTSQVEELVGALPSRDPLTRSGLERGKQYIPTRPGVEDTEPLNPYDLILPPSLALRLDRTNTALVLIDVQRFFCDPTVGLGQAAASQGRGEILSQYFERVQCAIREMHRLLNACRSAGIQVIHCRTAGQLSGGNDLGRKLRTRGISISLNSVEAEIMPDVLPTDGELILTKPASGVFNGTGVEQLLRNLGIENLVIAGVTIESALENTIRSAIDRGYGAVAVSDASASLNGFLYERPWCMDSGLVRVRNTDQVIALLNNRADIEGK